MFDLNEYLRTNRDSHGMVMRLACHSGLTLSVQASRFAYCTPREDGMPHYSHVEVGFPSERVEALMEWAESPDVPTETVYGWVPVEVVERVVNENGGELTQPEVEAASNA